MSKIELARSALTYLDAACSREDWIRIGMSAKSAGLYFEDFHNWSKNAENYAGEKDCKNVWKSFNESGAIKSATLFGMARSKGWQNPNKMQINVVNENDHNSYQKEKSSQQPHNDVTNKYAVDVWERCLPALPYHEYILRKQGKSDGLRYYPSAEQALIINGENVADYLVVPCWSEMRLQSLQFISPNKKNKLNLPRASFSDGYFSVGEINDRIYICEGIGQAWAINKASRAAAVVCFGSGRMKIVANILRAKYPNVRLVIAPDRGQEKKACETASAVGGQWIELPQDKPSNYDANDYAQDHGYDELAHVLACVKIPELRYKLLSSTDLLNTPPMRWIVHGVIPEKGLAAIYGASGSGKSFLILDMAFAIATDEIYWFGRRITHVPVTYICLEGDAGLGKRIKAWSLYFKKPLPDALRFIVQPFNLLSEDVSELAKSVISIGGMGGLVIIDTLNRAAPGIDENSSKDMGNLIAAANKLQNQIGGLVLLVHHTGKDATKGLRGHSSLYAALDGAIEVIKTDTRREWSVAKSKDDVTGDANSFKLEVVQLGFDDQDQEITSCVALFDDSKNTFKKKISLGSNQKIALEEIDKQLHNSLHTDKEDAPTSTKCLEYDKAVSLVAERIPTDIKHQKTRAISAIAGLVGKKYLGMKSGWLWRI